jgi:hypothetical protein
MREGGRENPLDAEDPPRQRRFVACLPEEMHALEEMGRQEIRHAGRRCTSTRGDAPVRIGTPRRASDPRASDLELLPRRQI